MVRRILRYRHLAWDLAVALSLAVLVWLYTRSRDQETLDQVQIPVMIQLSPAQRDHYDLEVNGSTRVAVSFAGPVSRIRELRRKLQMGAIQIAITLSVPEERQNEPSYYDSVRIEAAHLPPLPGVTAMVAEEGTKIPYTVHRLVERQLPVRLEYLGEARLTHINLEPPTVRVRGPKAILDGARVITTVPYAVPTVPEATAETEADLRGEAPLVPELGGRPIQLSPRTINFTCKVRPKQKVYQLADVPVHFLCPPGFPWRPRFVTDQAAKISVRVVGPAGEEPPPVLAFIDLTRANVGQGRNLLPVRLQLPRDFTAVQESPPLAAFFLDPIEPAASRPE